MEWSSLASLWYLIFGGLIGSFLALCIVRIPREESIISPRSHCRHCQKVLPAYDLIPIFSYLWLKGECRFCGESIATEYPVVEIVTAVMAVWTFETFGFRILGFSYFLFVASLIVITFIDLHFRIIPDSISIGGTLLGFLLSLHVLPIGYVNSLLGILTGGGLLLALALVYYKLTKREGMGGGDIKLAAMIGAFLGYKGVILTLLVSSVIGSIAGLLMIAINKKDLQYAIPYGPFLALGALLTLFFQDYFLFYLGYV